MHEATELDHDQSPLAPAFQIMDENSSTAIIQEFTESNIDQPKLTFELGEISTVNNSMNPMSNSTCLTKPSSSNRRFNVSTCSFPKLKYRSEHVLGNLMHSTLNSKGKIQKPKPSIISNTNFKVIFIERFVRFLAIFV